ncbi:hypothetical protein HYH03_016308 [Edaphochlamys debaryana]|uniref:J domain-containing protein n=1 Tax=Edaphochlamys debaryana TaxID=47281 RepID=A0A835XHT5_9CHLO|nr:hypothetical protein HYH03_016308 [Edaphochlamys debaryana]|eukprot:KAG2484922.1 hypothetical protein HYH03_016308 [Edaphochlamys debaryana]
MQAALTTSARAAAAGCLPRSTSQIAGASPASSGPARGCQLGVGASARAALVPRVGGGIGGGGRGLQSRREAVVCHAQKSFYEVLGVSPSASDRDIKASYRKLAMKLHPDVNKAPDAQKRFMEVKVAYETLSDAKQRAEYDRRLRMGGFAGGAGRAGYGTGGAWGSSGASYGGSSGFGGYGGYGPGAGAGGGYNAEPVPGLDELLKDLEKEFTAWVNQRSKARGGKARSLVEELEDLGGEFLDFLEDALGIKEQPGGEGPGAKGASGPSGASRGTGGAAGGWEPRNAAEAFDALWQAYGEPAAGNKSSSSSSSSYSSSSGSSQQAPPPRPPPPPPKRDPDADLDAELAALKRKLGKQ